MEEAFGHDNGLMTSLKTQPKLKFLSFICCVACRFGVPSGFVDKVFISLFISLGQMVKMYYYSLLICLVDLKDCFMV